MEPLFENVYVRDEAVMKEYLRRMLLLGPSAIFAYVLVGYMLVNLIVLWVWIGYFAFPYLIASAFILLLHLFIYRRTLKLTMDREKEVNGGEPLELHTTVMENSIACRTKIDAPEVAYSSIKKVIQTKNLIIVVTKAKLAFIMSKDGFTRGTPEALLQFFRDKGLKVKGK